MKALVLSGGGAKGAYQMGVFKALKKLHKKYDIVTGTSIGAINGMMYAQNNYYKCLELWKTIDFSKIYDDFVVNEPSDIVKNYANKILTGGVDTKKIQKIVYDNYNPTRMYNSKMTFGVVTYNVTNKEVLYATNKNTNPKKLAEYVMASATCYPVFKPTKVNGETFIDGGIYDNLPINLAIDLGATDILAVDLEAVGIVKKVKNQNINIKYIRPRNKINSFLVFETNALNRTIKLGYNDTMKSFNKLDGNLYTFKRNTILKFYKNYKDKFNLIAKNNNINIVLDNESDVLKIIEDTFSVFEVKEENIYTYKDTKKNIINSINNIISDTYNYELLKSIFDKKKIIKSIYTNLKNNDKINSYIFNLFNKELTVALFIYTIMG